MNGVIGDAIFGRIFRLMFSAALLAVAASFLAGINTVLYSLLAIAGDKGIPGSLKVMLNPGISYFLCVISLTASVYCYLLGVIFFIQKYDPHIVVVLVVLVSTGLFCGFIPTCTLFMVCLKFLQSGCA